MAKDDWNAFEIEEQIALQRESGRPYHEFIRVPSLSCGIYTLAPGAKDLQSPHDEDEVYFVVRGRGRVRVGGEERSIGPGSILYVRATSDHSFFEIEEEVTLLVFFGSGGPG